MNQDGVLAFGSTHKGSAGAHRREFQAPVAFLVSRGFGRFAIEADGDVFAGVGATPDRHDLVALQNSAVAEERGQVDVGPGESGPGKG